MLNIIIHQGNANQNDMIPLMHTKIARIKKVLAGILRNGNIHTLLVGMQSAVALETSLSVPQKLKLRVTT